MDGPVSPPEKKSYTWIWIVVGVVGVIAIGCCAAFFLFGAYMTTLEGTPSAVDPDGPTETPFTLFDSGPDGSSREQAVPAGTIGLADNMAFKVTGLTNPADDL